MNQNVLNVMGQKIICFDIEFTIKASGIKLESYLFKVIVDAIEFTNIQGIYYFIKIFISIECLYNEPIIVTNLLKWE